MKTIYVEPAQVEMNGTILGTVTSIGVNGSVELFSSTGSAWVNLMGSGAGLASKQIQIASGISESGVDWAAVEADILSQLNLIKAEEQAPILPPAPNQ
jgi:hypothetical protein